MPGETYHRRAHAGPGNEAVGRHIGRHIGVGVILHRQRQGSVILGTRSCLHPVSHLLLHHHRNAVQGNLPLKKSHDDRRRNIVRQIGHHLDGPSAVFLPGQRGYIHLQYILADHVYIIIFCQRVLQNRNQIAVDLHRCDLSGSLGQILGHGADTRPDLQHKIFLGNAGGPYDLLQYPRINQKILAEFLLKMKTVLLQNGYGLLRIPQLCQLHVLLIPRRNLFQ